MNKYLICFLLAFSCMNVYAADLINVFAGIAQVTDFHPINFDVVSSTVADGFFISNSVIVIDDFSNWQNWNPGSVTIGSGVGLSITDMNTITNGEKVKHILGSDSVTLSTDNVDRLYNVKLIPDALNYNVYINIVRETNYENVFDDSRGKFLENIRLNNPNDKMLLAMDNAKSMAEINSIMDSSYHFNPMILMNPVKTINRASINDMFFDRDDIGLGINVDYIMSDKIDNFGTHIYMNNKYRDLYFNIGVNLNRFLYKDAFNEFDGFFYGADLHARQYLNNVWLDGLLALNRTTFNAGNIYINGDVSNNPSGISEYARFNIGYDYGKISDFVFSPFVGTIVQKSEIMGLSDVNVNLYTGLIGKYGFITDGIKYEYSATVATDEEACWNIGANIGFLSVVDKAGASMEIATFKDDFGTNYKFAINAKMEF